MSLSYANITKKVRAVMAYFICIFFFLQSTVHSLCTLLELVSTKDDIKSFCNFVTSMMVFLDQFFGRRLGRRIVTEKVQCSVSKPLCYRGSISDPYAEGPGFESL